MNEEIRETVEKQGWRAAKVGESVYQCPYGTQGAWAKAWRLGFFWGTRGVVPKHWH